MATRSKYTVPKARTAPPVPVRAVPGEPAAHQRIRALMLADRMGWLVYIGPVNPDTVLPTNLTYAVYLLPGPTLPAPDAEPPTSVEGLEVWHADEVLGLVRGIAIARGYPELAAWREGQPGA